MAGSDNVLVYHYRHNGSPAVKDGLAAIKQPELDRILKEYPTLQSSIKAISRGAMAVEIHQRDLLRPSQASMADQHPNDDANVAGIKLPLSVSLSSVLDGQYSELVILGKKL